MLQVPRHLEILALPDERANGFLEVDVKADAFLEVLEQILVCSERSSQISVNALAFSPEAVHSVHAHKLFASLFDAGLQLLLMHEICLDRRPDGAVFGEFGFEERVQIRFTRWIVKSDARVFVRARRENFRQNVVRVLHVAQHLLQSCALRCSLIECLEQGFQCRSHGGVIIGGEYRLSQLWQCFSNRRRRQHRQKAFELLRTREHATVRLTSLSNVRRKHRAFFTQCNSEHG
mmetsp:Transcript_18407/g.59873  ORF Transcript_18407/g.59873 Transcript_18407/m.59873 type:complete len:233 (-) Transcript_18407:1563-2261(-)